MNKALLFSLLLALSTSVFADSDAINEKAKINKMAKATLAEFYALDQNNRTLIENSAGYGIFSNTHVSVIVASLGGGSGVVFNKMADSTVYMKMAELGIGLGAGLKEQHFILVFDSAESLTRFCEKGWVLGSRADATAQSANKGKALDIETATHGVQVFQFSKRGLVLEATVKGNKFWPDEKLNN